MPVYEYACRSCGERDSLVRSVHDDTRPDRLPCSCGAEMGRKFSVPHATPMMHAAYSTATGSVVSDRRQFASELRRISDERTAETGIVHSFVPVDLRDKERLGVTDKGLDTQRANMEANPGFYAKDRKAVMGI